MRIDRFRVSSLTAAILAGLAAPAAMAQAQAQAPAPPSTPYGLYQLQDQCLRYGNAGTLNCYKIAAWPSAQETRAVYPSGALASGIDGVATIRCAIDMGNALFDCELVSQSPAGSGFGEAALKLAPQFKVGPDQRGGPMAGTRIVVPVWFEADPKPATTAAAAAPHDNWMRGLLTGVGCSIVRTLGVQAIVCV